MLSAECSTTFKAPWAQNGKVASLPLFPAFLRESRSAERLPSCVSPAWVSSFFSTLGLTAPQVPVPVLQL